MSDENIKKFSELATNIEFESLLSENAMTKFCSYLYKNKENDEKTIICFDKSKITKEESSDVLLNIDKMKEVVNNPPFHKFEGNILISTGFKATFITPATEDHIDRYRSSRIIYIDETYEMYEKYSLPYMLTQLSINDWVYNILDGKSETERVLFKNDNFLIVADLKWNNKDKFIKCIALPFRRDIYSLRQLDDTTLPLLIDIRDNAKKLLVEKFHADERVIQLYIHYHPSFYHLHVHIETTVQESPSIYIGRAHFLDDVIQNIRMNSKYYQSVCLKMRVPEKRAIVNAYPRELIFETPN